VIDGNWKTKPICINLGTMLLDNNVVHFDLMSYISMDKKDNNDLEQCEEAWSKNIAGEF
jgi:hypothetical protein